MPDDHCTRFSVRPTVEQSRQAAQQARARFERVLSAWACDLLELGQRRLRTPSWQAMSSASMRSLAA